MCVHTQNYNSLSRLVKPWIEAKKQFPYRFDNPGGTDPTVYYIFE